MAVDMSGTPLSAFRCASTGVVATELERHSNGARIRGYMHLVGQAKGVPAVLSEDRRFGRVVIRTHERAVFVGESEVALTRREFEILAMLSRHPGWVLSADQLAQADEDECSPESVSVHVSRLRHKLADAGARGLVETVRGIGYRLHAPAPSSVPVPDEPIERDALALREAAWALYEIVVEIECGSQDTRRRSVTDILVRARLDIEALGE